MCLRISSALAILLFAAACGGGAESPEPEGEMIDCAIGPGAELQPVCTLEWTEGEWQGAFIVHHPDGGFRRLKVTPDGIAAFDGAEDVVSVGDNSDLHAKIEVDGDRYRLPQAPFSGS